MWLFLLGRRRCYLELNRILQYCYRHFSLFFCSFHFLLPILILSIFFYAFFSSVWNTNRINLAEKYMLKQLQYRYYLYGLIAGWYNRWNIFCGAIYPLLQKLAANILYFWNISSRVVLSFCKIFFFHLSLI